MTKTFPEVISGIRTAKRGVEVREDIAQMGEYVEQFAATAAEKAEAAAASEKKASDAVANIDQQTEDAVAAVNTAETKALQDVETARSGALTDIGNAKAGALEDIETARTGAVGTVTGIGDAAVQAVTDTKTTALTALEENRASALQEMQGSVDAAAGSAEKAAASEGNAKASEDAAKASEEAAAKSEANSSASASAAKKSEANALKYSQETGAKAGTDPTLTVSGAPADAKQVGDELAVRYTKEQVDILLTQYKADWLLSAYPVGSLYLSADPTSPAELFGGTWEQIKDRFILAAGDTYAAGSTGGEESVTLTSENIPLMWDNGGIVCPINTKGSNVHVNQWFWIYTATQVQASAGYDSYFGHYTSVGTRNNTAVNNMPPYTTKYVWQRIE